MNNKKKIDEFYKKELKARKKISLKNHQLMKMAAIAKSPDGRVAINLDEIDKQD